MSNELVSEWPYANSYGNISSLSHGIGNYLGSSADIVCRQTLGINTSRIGIATGNTVRGTGNI